MEEKMGLFSQFMNSITNLKVYSYFLEQSAGQALLYLFVISIFFATLGGMSVVRDINSGVNTFKSYFESEVPPFLFENGELTVDAEMPYVISQSDDEIIIIDTSGELDQSVLDDYESGFFISKDKAVQKENRFQTRHFDFAALEGVTFSKDDVIKWIPLLKWLNLFIVGFGLTFYIVGKLLSALIVSIGELIIAKMTKHKIGFADLYKLSIYTLTLPILLQTLVGLLGLTIPYFGFIYYGIALLYLGKALKIIRDSEEKSIDLNARIGF